MKSRHMHLTEQERELKDDLRAFGAHLQSKSNASKDAFSARLDQLWEETEPQARKVRMPAWFRSPFILAPVGIAALVLAIGLAQRSEVSYISAPPVGPAGSTMEEQNSLPYTQPDLPEESYPAEDEAVQYKEAQFVEPRAAAGISAESSVGFTPRSRSAKTFKDRFLGALGRHDADPDEVASREQMIEQDVHSELMSTKSQDETVSALRSIFEALGGFVESVNTYNNRSSRDSVHIKGKVPARSLEAFRAMLKNFAGEDKYYRERLEAYNRTADVVAIEEEGQRVEDAIAYLEESLAQESDPRRRAELEAELETHRARLREREATREVIQDRVEYADVSVAVSLLPTFWRANSLKDFRQLYLGFNEPTLLDQFKINATAFVLGLLHALSYFFWVIPIVWWIWRRKSRRAKGLLEELE